MISSFFVDQLGNTYARPDYISETDWKDFLVRYFLFTDQIAKGKIKPVTDITGILKRASIERIVLDGGHSTENSFSQADSVTFSFVDSRCLKIKIEWHGNEASLRGSLT